MEEFFDILQEYILVVNGNEIKFCNNALKNLLGYNLIDLNRCNILDLIIKGTQSGEYITINDKNNKEITLEPIIRKVIIEGKELSLIILKEVKSRSYHIGDLELILDNVALYAWIKDVNGKYLYANKRYADTLNLDKFEMIGKDDNYVWDINQSNIFKSEDRRLIKEKGYFVFTQQVNIGNNYRWFNVIKFVVLDELERVKFVIGLADDISDQITLNEKKKILEHEVQMEILKNEFFTNVSHEFKTPLNIIITAIKLIDTYIDSVGTESLNYANIKNHIDSMKRNSYRLEKLVNNLIDITKINCGDYKISMKDYNIISLVEDVVLSVVNYINSENISIVFDTNEEEKIIRCDKDSIERIILNLLSNSIKHIYGKGNILVKIKAYEDYIDISVKDNGEGIPREYIDNVFNKFEQVDKSLSRKHEGSGLGLFIVKSLVEMHNGIIKIDSKEGIGTEVIIRLYSKEAKSTEEVEEGVEELINKCNKEFSDIYYI